MALLTFGGSVVRGTPQTVVLNKSVLTNLSAVSGDDYWSDSANIRKVTVAYETVEGDRRRILFDFTQATPESSIRFSTEARQNWYVGEVILHDFDGGVLILKAAVLEAQVPGGITDIILDLGELV